MITTPRTTEESRNSEHAIERGTYHENNHMLNEQEYNKSEAVPMIDVDDRLRW